MKLKELKKDVLALSFITPEEAEVGFLNSVRRALSIIFSDLKITGRKTLTVQDKSINTIHEDIFHKGKENLTLPLTGRAYSLKLSGMGHFTVYDGPIVHRESFDSDEVVFKGFINHGGSIEFGGDYAYTIVSLVTYSNILSDGTEDIPNGKEVFIDMKSVPDFFAFSKAPTDGSGNDIKGFMTEGTKIILPNGYTGRVTVYYRKRPLPILDDGEQYIELEAGYLPLLAPLAASLLLADDDRELSDTYMKLYTQMASDMKAADIEEKYVKTNGWA